MAKKRLKIKDKQGNIVNYDISSASVTIDVEGKTLDVKLTELVAAIQAAVKTVVYNGTPHYVNNSMVDLGNQIQPDWAESATSYPSFIRNKPDVVTGIKVGEGGETITPTGGIITLPNSGGGQVTDADTEMSSTSENAVQNKVIKAYVDNLISGLIDGAPQALDTLNELAAALGDNANFATAITQQLATKQDKLQAGNGIDIAQDGKTVSVDAEVVQPVTADGTFAVRIGNNTYTINLNHTHQGMAKLQIVDDEPESPAMDTIYAQVDNAQEPSEIIALWVAGLEFTGGGAAPGTPRLTRPADGSTIDFGETVNGTKSMTINIKGNKYLTMPLVVELGSSSTGYAFDTTNLPTGVTYDSNTGKLTVAADAARSLDGVDIVVVYTDTPTNVDGVLGITSASPDNITVEVSLVATHGLPSGYTKCVYIKNASNTASRSYIDSGILVSSELRVVAKMVCAPYSEYKAPFGAIAGSNNYRSLCYNGFSFKFEITGSSYGNDYVVADENAHEFDLNKNRLIFDGVEYPSSAYGEWTSDQNFFLFSLSNSGRSEGARPDVKIYYLKLYNGNQLVRDFVGAYNNSTQKYGMYDFVSSQFFPSNGTDPLTGLQIS